MKIIAFAILSLTLFAASLSAQVQVVTPARGFTTDYVGTGATVVTLSNTPNTVITANTVLGQALICASATSTTVTMTATDAAGKYLVNALQITASSAPVTLINAYAGIKLVGLNMWASAINSIDCWFTGKN